MTEKDFLIDIIKNKGICKVRPSEYLCSDCGEVACTYEYAYDMAIKRYTDLYGNIALVEELL